eukprot:5849498-Amphidinium_carterae.1
MMYRHGEQFLLVQLDTLGMGNEDSSIARAGRMSRVGTRAGRVLRVIRLIRLIRIIKLYKHMLDVRPRT